VWCGHETSSADSHLTPQQTQGSQSGFQAHTVQDHKIHDSPECELIFTIRVANVTSHEIRNGSNKFYCFWLQEFVLKKGQENFKMIIVLSLVPSSNMIHLGCTPEA